MKAVIRVRRGKSWRYVVRGTVDPRTGTRARPADVLQAFMRGDSPDAVAAHYLTDRLTVEAVIREARWARWWRE